MNRMFSHARSIIAPLFGDQRSWLWVAAALVSAFLAFYWDATGPKVKNESPTDDPESASTFIPAGYVLVPIEVANFESLDSILGHFGIVDLYVPSEDPKYRARKIAERLKILRAPLNPSHFAVLARESESARLVSHSGPFTVVVQNPDSSGTGVVKAFEDTESKRARSASATGRSRITVEVLDGDVR